MSLEISKNQDPFELFTNWYETAKEGGERDVTVMSLATANKAGESMVRIVLLKLFNQDGFCFFTNYESEKSKALLENPQGALCFHWTQPLHRQIRIQGPCEKTTYEESNKYFHSRPRGSQLAALASPQSRPLDNRQQLDDLIKEFEDQYGDDPIPCPDYWGGFRIKPLRIEFWQEQEFRRHDRFAFTRKSLDKQWTLTRLAP